MAIVDKNHPGKAAKAPPTPPESLEQTTQAPAETPVDFDVQDRLARARVNRNQAETARQKIINEIMEASKALYQNLVEEGSQALEKAKQLETEAELHHLEAQRELEHSNNIRSETDSYREKVIAQTQRQAQEMLHQAQAIKAEAIAFRERLLEQVRQQTQEELDQAQSERVEADAYREKIIAEAQRQAQEVMDQARAAAQHEGAEVLRSFSVEAERILAEAELIKAAAQEQLEAQKLYADLADLESESREVLEKARAKLVQQPPQVEDDALNEEQVSEEAPDSSPPPDDDNETIQYERLLKLGYSSGEPEELPLPQPEEASQTHQDETSPGKLEEPDNYQEQLPDNELVLGLEIGARSKAYPLRVVTEAKVINDSFNDEEVVVTFGPPSELGMIFKRHTENRFLTFQALSETSNGLMLMKDQETGTTWEALTGRAISGPLVHAELQRLTYEYSFWFAWRELHPQSEVYTYGQPAHAAGASA